MKLITSPTAIATVVLIGFARSQLDKNSKTKFESSRTWFALLAAVGAVIITTVIVAVMIPLSIRITVTHHGNRTETALLVYLLTHAVAVGTAVYAAKNVSDCVRELWAHKDDAPDGG